MTHPCRSHVFSAPNASQLISRITFSHLIGRKILVWGTMRKVQERTNKGIFPCNQWRRVWSVPSGFNELRDVAEIYRKGISFLHRSRWGFMAAASALIPAQRSGVYRMLSEVCSLHVVPNRSIGLGHSRRASIEIKIKPRAIPGR